MLKMFSWGKGKIFPQFVSINYCDIIDKNVPKSKDVEKIYLQ